MYNIIERFEGDTNMKKFKAGTDLTIEEYNYLEKHVLNSSDPCGSYLDYLKDKHGPCKNNYFATKACISKLPSFNGMHRHHNMEYKVANLGDPEVARANPWEWQEARNLTYCRPAEHTLVHILETEQYGLGVFGAMKLLTEYTTMDPTIKAILQERVNESATVFTWNQTVFLNATAMLNTYGLCYLHLATGAGKSTSAVEVAKSVNRDFLVVCNSTKINTDWKNRNNLNPRFRGAITPIYFKNHIAEYNLNDMLVIIDEAHHLTEKNDGGRVIIQARKDNPNMMLLGLSASEFRAKNRKKADGSMEAVWNRVFEGHVAQGIKDIAEGIEKGVFAPITYVCACYDKKAIDETISLCAEWRDTEKKVSLRNKLDLLQNQANITNILRTYQPETMIRDLVFIEHISEVTVFNPTTGLVEKVNDYEQAKESIKAAYPHLTDDNFRIVHSKQTPDENKKAFEWFETEADDARYLVSVGMIKEGYHPEILTGGIIFRRIGAATVFEQILGRFAVLVAKAKHKITVFDFVDAIRSSQFKFEAGLSSSGSKKVRPDVIQKLSTLEACGVNIIDYTKDFLDLTSEIVTETCAPVFTFEELT